MKLSPKVVIIVFLIASCTFLGILLYSYYNHTKDKTFDAEAYANKLLVDCKNASQKRSCYFAHFQKLSESNDFSISFNILRELQKIDTSVEYCHTIAHEIGYKAAIRNPHSWEKLVKGIDIQACTYGFLHGIIEGLASINKGNFTLTKDSITTLCDKVVTLSKGKATDAINERMCAHIMGHLLVLQYSDTVDDPIKTCQELNQNSQAECSQGAFMEHDFKDVLRIHGLAKEVVWNLDNVGQLETMCGRYSGAIGSECWKALSHAYMQIAQGNYSTIFTLCSNRAPKEYRDSCYFAGSYDLVLQMLSGFYKSDSMGKLCSVYLTASEKNECMKAVAEYVIWSSPLSAGRFRKFCSDAEISSKKSCYRIYGKAIGEYISDNSQRELCQKVEPSYLNACLNI